MMWKHSGIDPIDARMFRFDFSTGLCYVLVLIPKYGIASKLLKSPHFSVELEGRRQSPMKWAVFGLESLLRGL